MINNSKTFVSRPPSLRYAAMQQILGVASLELTHEAESTPTHAVVYPASGDVEGWVVEAPATRAQVGCAPRTFTGTACLLKALEHAHSTYGSVSYLSR